jgi:membrane peptidoglycan carboxypeptidase
METTHGKIKQNFPVIKGRIMDAKSAEYIQKLLRQVVVTGSGREANIPGYNVSGKTGTGQIANPKGGYFEGRWTTSFLGFINEADYQLGILVTLKNPKPKPGQTKDVSGGMVAAPVFRRIVERILMFKQILPINMRSHTVVRISERQQDYRVPDVSGMTLEDVEAKLSGEVDIMARGNGPLVVKQFPPAQRLMSRRDKLLVFLGNGDDLAVNRMFRKEPFMRHFIGKSMREAVEMLQGFDQSVYFEGSGFVVEQSPGAGTPLQKESQISLKFSPLKR